MVTKAQARATQEYLKNHQRRFILQCHNEKDKDIIEYLESCGNVNKTIKDALRESIKKPE